MNRNRCQVSGVRCQVLYVLILAAAIVTAASSTLRAQGGGQGNGPGAAQGQAQAPAAPAQGGAAAQPQGPPKTAGEAFKNIQVMKDMPVTQVITTMEFFAASLGVDCDHCHVRPQWDREDKAPKHVARFMIKMVQEMNKANFGGAKTVTCYTCHRASLKPVSTPLVANEQPTPVWPAEDPDKAPKEKAATVANPPAPEQLFDKYLATIGGAAAINKNSTRVIQATVTDFEGEKAPADIIYKADARLRNIHLKEGDNITEYSATKGWIRELNRPAYDMGRPDMDAARMEDSLYFAPRWKEFFKNPKVGNELAKIGGREAYVVETRTDIFPLVKVYFDKDSGLLLRTESYYETWVGRFYTRTDFMDYRDVDGLKIPFKWTTAKIRGVLFQYQIDKVQQNVPVDDAKFEKPAPPARPAASAAPAAAPASAQK